jgi:hypothetical protein
MSWLELYWIPLGAGGSPVVRVSGRSYEALVAWRAHRPRRQLYHAALIAHRASGHVTVEVAPVPDGDAAARGVVAEGAVGVAWLRRLRIFRYEVRRWPGGAIPDLRFAVASPVTVTADPAEVTAVLDALAEVPAPVWGRDELGLGEMWNSNSVVAFALSRAGVLAAAGDPPAGGRAPGWDAGVRAAGATLPRGHRRG